MNTTTTGTTKFLSTMPLAASRRQTLTSRNRRWIGRAVTAMTLAACAAIPTFTIGAASQSIAAGDGANGSESSLIIAGGYCDPYGHSVYCWGG
jgi:hypothetical protein